jgi:hypothetical protein
MVNNFSGGKLDDYIVTLVKLINLLNAEAVLTFVVALPLISLTTIAFLENTFRDEYLAVVTKVSDEHTLEKIEGGGGATTK